MASPSFVAPAGSSTPRKTLPPGTYLGRCYQMVALGTHEEEYQGEKKTPFKIWLGWEFPDELDTFGDSSDQQPYTMGKELTFSMHEKSNFRLTLEGWRGKKFTDDEARTFDCGKLLGAPCIVNVVSYIKKSGEEGVKIGSLTPLMKGQMCPPAINQIQALAFNDFDFGLFDSLPKFLVDKIKISPEYKAMADPEPVYQAPASSGPTFPDMTDNGEPLPF